MAPCGLGDKGWTTLIGNLLKTSAWSYRLEGVVVADERIRTATRWIREGEWGSLGNKERLFKEFWVRNPEPKGRAQQQDTGRDLGS